MGMVASRLLRCPTSVTTKWPWREYRRGDRALRDARLRLGASAPSARGNEGLAAAEGRGGAGRYRGVPCAVVGEQWVPLAQECVTIR